MAQGNFGGILPREFMTARIQRGSHDKDDPHTVRFWVEMVQRLIAQNPEWSSLSANELGETLLREGAFKKNRPGFLGGVCELQTDWVEKRVGEMGYASAKDFAVRHNIKVPHVRWAENQAASERYRKMTPRIFRSS